MGDVENILIRSIVVFTDNRIEVQNKYSKIRTCFVSQLAYIIDEFKNEIPYSDKEMEKVESVIKIAESKESYPFDFATVIAILEEASAKKEAEYKEKRPVTAETQNMVWEGLKKFFTSKYTGYIGSAAVAAVVTLVSTVAVSAIRKG